MIAIISLLVVITLSILVTRVATIALTHTGLSRESARFQARSAFTGAGFTTTESEKVVNHPVRRRIVLLLMLLGNAGIVTAVSSLILTFVGPDRDTALLWKIVLLAAGLAVLWTVASSTWVDRRLSRLIDRLLKHHTNLDVKDYAGLLRIAGGYRLAELLVDEHDWIAHKNLDQARLRDEGLLVLGIQREDGTYIGAPNSGTSVLPDDTLFLYGRDEAIAALDVRKEGVGGDRKHEEAVREQEQVERTESVKDPATEDPPPTQRESP